MDCIADYLITNWHILLGGGILGFLVGVITGLFGAGGGFIITPILNIFIGLPMNIAVGTSACQVLGASAFSLYHHFDRKLPGIRIAITMGLGIPAGSYFGVRTVENLVLLKPIVVMGKELRAVDFVLLLVFAVFLSLIAAWLFIDNYYIRHGKEEDESSHRGMLAGLRIPPMIRYRTILSGEFSATVLFLLGIFMGFMSGLLGIGGGVIIMPILFYLVGQGTKDATKTDLMLVFASGFFATVTHALNNNINYPLVAFLVSGAFFGTRTGARIQKIISGKSIRKYFTFIVLAAVLIVTVKLLRMVW